MFTRTSLSFSLPVTARLLDHNNRFHDLPALGSYSVKYPRRSAPQCLETVSETKHTGVFLFHIHEGNNRVEPSGACKQNPPRTLTRTGQQMREAPRTAFVLCSCFGELSNMSIHIGLNRLRGLTVLTATPRAAGPPGNPAAADPLQLWSLDGKLISLPSWEIPGLFSRSMEPTQQDQKVSSSHLSYSTR